MSVTDLQHFPEDSSVKSPFIATFCYFVWISFCFASNRFDDLSTSEIKQVVSLIRNSGQFSDELRFPVVRVHEPKKMDWLADQSTDLRLSRLMKTEKL